MQIAEESGIDLIEEIYFGAETWVEAGIDIVNTSHVRLDFDSRATSHSKCHLQFASFNNFRISSSTLLNPFIFFEWIVMNENLKDQALVKAKSSYNQIAKFHYRKNSTIEVQEDNYPILIVR